MWVLNLLNLAPGTSLMLYDGSPFYPDAKVLLRLADQLE
jgi:acyl-coenzyme A synthetase/AMP-(fatty) acid ligase